MCTEYHRCERYIEHTIAGYIHENYNNIYKNYGVISVVCAILSRYRKYITVLVHGAFTPALCIIRETGSLL